MTELLADHTTLRVGGPARDWLEPETETELLDAVRAADEAREPLLILGGGSNVLVADRGFDGTVVQLGRLRGVRPETATGGRGLVTAAAGEPWDDFVDSALDSWGAGIEALSGIPGLVGATPIQNVGAYGQEVGQSIDRVRVYDRELRCETTWSAPECRFGYRQSRFKAQPNRFVVLSVSFGFLPGEQSMPIRYAELARRLGVQVGERAPLTAVREAVLELRRGKGMVLDADDHDTWSAGSFFTNPVMEAGTAEALPQTAPRYPQPDGRVKTSAAWLIEHAGFDRGFGTGAAGLSTKHVLALTNRGQASAADLVDLAKEIRAGVVRAFGIALEPEPVFVGVDW